MDSVIRELLLNIEKEYGITILLAVENGSRAWNMESKDSDFDVRFVFKHSIDKYLQLNPPKEVIIKIDGVIDVVGFDVRKFTKLVVNSNPTGLEWLRTPIVYLERQSRLLNQLRHFAKYDYNPKKLYHHYLSLTRGNYQKYIEKGKKVSVKRYLYCLRGILNADLIARNITPSLDFEQNARDCNLPTKINTAVFNLLNKKRNGDEAGLCGRLSVIDSFIEFALKNPVDVNNVDKSIAELDSFVITELAFKV